MESVANRKGCSFEMVTIVSLEMTAGVVQKGWLWMLLVTWTSTVSGEGVESKEF